MCSFPALQSSTARVGVASGAKASTRPFMLHFQQSCHQFDAPIMPFSSNSWYKSHITLSLYRFQASQSSAASWRVASDAEASTSPHSEAAEHHDDMEFARRLQEEEDRIHYERMLQMAGFGNNLTRVAVHLPHLAAGMRKVLH